MSDYYEPYLEVLEEVKRLRQEKMDLVARNTQHIQLINKQTEVISLLEKQLTNRTNT